MAPFGRGEPGSQMGSVKYPRLLISPALALGNIPSSCEISQKPGKEMLARPQGSVQVERLGRIRLA
jgi:hypothetical protein